MIDVKKKRPSIIRAHVDWDGTFASTKDKKYQFINWTDEYTLYMHAWDENGKEHKIVKVFDNKSDALAMMNKKRKTKYWMGQVRQTRVLGDGSKDDVCVGYTANGVKTLPVKKSAKKKDHRVTSSVPMTFGLMEQTKTVRRK